MISARLRIRQISRTLCLIVMLAALAGPAQAGPASLLLDIHTGQPVDRETSVEGALSLGSQALVVLSDPWSGRELWVTDGTDVGTRALFDLCPGPCSSRITPLGVVGRVGILGIGNVDGRSRVWRSDGTRSGTFPLTPVEGGELDVCGPAATAGGRLVFEMRTEIDCALWTTDGTPAGTAMLAELDPSGLTTAGSQAFFVSFQGRSGWALWRTDGTPEGTIQLRLWAEGPPRDLVAVGSRLFLTALDEGRELWTSDGTVAGTRRLTRFAAPEPFVVRAGFPEESVLLDAGGRACFLAQDGSAGRELWCSDGTAAGTRQATSLVLANPFVNLDTWRVERLGNRLLFPANDGTSGNRWWTSDGRPASTAPLSGCPGGCPVLDVGTTPVRLGSRVFFAAIGQGPFDPEEPPTTDLWVTDGTGAGTRRIGDLCSTCRIDRMIPLLGKLYFSAGQHPFSYDLWASDGTAQGTRKVLPLDDFAQNVLAHPPAAVGGRALIVQETYSPDTSGLWMSDGTPESTHELSFLARSGPDSFPRSLVPALQGIRFLAGEDLWESRGTAATTARVEGAPTPDDSLTAFGPLTLFRNRDDSTLWRTDGTAAGTFRLTPAGFSVAWERAVVVLGNRAVFVAHGQDDPFASLWATDGTVAGTHKVLDLPDSEASLLPAGPSALVVMSGGAETILWRTDGTAAGTHEIPLPAGLRFESAGPVAQLGNTLFFTGYRDRYELWRADGTAAGTRPFAADLLGEVEGLAVHAGSLYILGRKRDLEDPERAGLWRSDGTEAGTVLLASAPLFTVGAPSRIGFTPVGNLLFFVLEDEQGRELWRTDGTPAGTFRVRDIVPGKASSNPAFLTALNGRLYFAASGTGHGTELWESDGTEAGTRLVQDIYPGILSSLPQSLVASGGRLFFSADDGVHGREPWVYTPGGAACEATETALCLGERFLVEADWRDFNGGIGRGRAVALTADTGYFWFFDPANLEVILKVLDGQGINGHHWVFYGALSNVEYILTVTDTRTGAARRYINPAGRLGSVADTQAFGPLGASEAGKITLGPAAERAGEAIVSTLSIPAKAACAPSSTRLCLNDGRFAVEARWKAQGRTGAGQVMALPGGDTGYFWFFDPNNVEVVLKVLDGRPLNGKFWVFYGALSNVEYTLTVTDTVTGTVKTYTNPNGRLASVADTGAF